MVFECLDSPFGGVYPMVVWFNEHQLASLGGEVLLYDCSGLIVCDVYPRGETFFLEIF